MKDHPFCKTSKLLVTDLYEPHIDLPLIRDHTATKQTHVYIYRSKCQDKSQAGSLIHVQVLLLYSAIS